MTSLTWRLATQDELERTDTTAEANLIDGASAVLRDGGLIGILNEYGTAVWAADGVDRLQLERFNEAAGELA